MLDEKRVRAMAEGVRQIIALPDPVGEMVSMTRRPNGLRVGRVRVPLGVIGIIYEARPNVTVDAAALCLKSGNAVVLRGGTEAINSNRALSRIIEGAAEKAGVPAGSIALIEDVDRAAVMEMIRLDKYFDAIIPRGGENLVRAVAENAVVPIIYHAAGNCHVYVDKAADLAMACDIVYNAKVQRPGVCNAMETLLVHRDIAQEFIPMIFSRLKERNVELRGCATTQSLDPSVKAATEEDWVTEYLDLILAVRVVDDMDSAIDHIHRYGSRHSEAIVTESYSRAQEFLYRVDAAAVYVNASTRFTDGFEFGFGAEIGISTQKLHARGPMGLPELTSTKFIIYGDGQVRC
jgi:glutamate-5-semialdehyde dehydrogenase